jgi:DNA mismatch endonuclease, patch repair protein
MDKISGTKRSKNMAAVRSKNTSPELRVRRMLHSMGYRFRLHRKDLPGKPDIVLSKYRLCIFVNGCFWHQHSGCKRATIPQTRKEFWGEKLYQNKKRDELCFIELVRLGWQVCTIWECEAKNLDALATILLGFFKRFDND